MVGFSRGRGFLKDSFIQQFFMPQAVRYDTFLSRPSPQMTRSCLPTGSQDAAVEKELGPKVKPNTIKETLKCKMYFPNYTSFMGCVDKQVLLIHMYQMKFRLQSLKEQEATIYSSTNFLPWSYISSQLGALFTIDATYAAVSTVGGSSLSSTQ